MEDKNTSCEFELQGDLHFEAGDDSLFWTQGCSSLEVQDASCTDLQNSSRVLAINRLISPFEKLGAYTSRGERLSNEDSYAWSFSENKKSGLLCVCDGVGGEANGEALSRICSGSLIDAWESLDKNKISLACRLNRAVRITDINASRITAYLGGEGGTTLVALAYSGSEIAVVSVGDSRVYFLKNDELTYPFLETGRVSEQSNQLKSAIGYSLIEDNKVFPQSKDFNFSEPVRFLLCSDGVWGSLDEGALKKILVTQNNPDVCARELVERAVEAGGVRADNATALVFDFAPQV